MNACAACGLQLYRFGETVSIPWFHGNWRPDSWYERIKHNRKAGLHTLCLLDIKVKEPNLEQLARGRTVYEPPRYMSVAQSIEQLIEVEEARGEGVYGPETMAVGLARIGSEDQVMAAGPLSLLAEHEMGPPLHAMVICGELHDLEMAFLKTFEVSPGCVCMQKQPTFADEPAVKPTATAAVEVVEEEEPEAAPVAPVAKPAPAVPKVTAAVVEESDDEELNMAPEGLLELEDAMDNL